jgi:hypothetical protein
MGIAQCSVPPSSLCRLSCEPHRICVCGWAVRRCGRVIASLFWFARRAGSARDELQVSDADRGLRPRATGRRFSNFRLRVFSRPLYRRRGVRCARGQCSGMRRFIRGSRRALTSRDSAKPRRNRNFPAPEHVFLNCGERPAQHDGGHIIELQALTLMIALLLAFHPHRDQSLNAADKNRRQERRLT